MPGIRAAMCHDTYSVHQGVEDDDMNILVMGSRIVGFALDVDIVETFPQPGRARCHRSPWI
jgi:ribose 5-phosphate isomerase B